LSRKKIHLPKLYSMEKLENSLKFKTWLEELKKNQIHLNHYRELASIKKHNGEILFSFLEIDATSPESQKLPSSVLLRGHFVSVVTCLRDKDNKKRYYLLVKQRRVATGGFFYEHPAGMCDNETDPYKVALKEVEEETGLKIQKEDLFLLHEKILYSSPGLLDEAGYFFGCEIELPQRQIQEFQNKITGAKQENEYIQTFLCPEEEIFNYLQNSNGILATLLFQKKFLDTSRK